MIRIRIEKDCYGRDYNLDRYRDRVEKFKKLFTQRFSRLEKKESILIKKHNKRIERNSNRRIIHKFKIVKSIGKRKLKYEKEFFLKHGREPKLKDMEHFWNQIPDYKKNMWNSKHPFLLTCSEFECKKRKLYFED